MCYTGKLVKSLVSRWMKAYKSHHTSHTNSRAHPRANYGHKHHSGCTRWKSELKIDLGDTEKFFFFSPPLLLFQFNDTEHQINAKGDGLWHDLLFVVTSLAKGINNAIGLKYVLFISLISLALPLISEVFFMQQFRYKLRIFWRFAENATDHPLFSNKLWQTHMLLEQNPGQSILCSQRQPKAWLFSLVPQFECALYCKTADDHPFREMNVGSKLKCYRCCIL